MKRFNQYVSRLGLATIVTAVLSFAPSSMHAGALSNKPFIKVRHGLSSNWSGYAAFGTSGSYSTVTANWVQPSVNCSSGDGYSSYWVGLDGYNTSTVEQLGTEADCHSGSATYYAWYEMYPHVGFVINISVHPNDQLKASVTYRGNGRYQLTINDATSGQVFSTTQHSTSARRGSAEVIVEAPWSNGTLPLANFGTANFTSSLANNLPLGSFTHLDPITMVNPYGMKATPSVFDSTKQNFSDTWSAN